MFACPGDRNQQLLSPRPDSTCVCFPRRETSEILDSLQLLSLEAVLSLILSDSLTADTDSRQRRYCSGLSHFIAFNATQNKHPVCQCFSIQAAPEAHRVPLSPSLAATHAASSKAARLLLLTCACMKMSPLRQGIMRPRTNTPWWLLSDHVDLGKGRKGGSSLPRVRDTCTATAWGKPAESTV